MKRCFLKVLMRRLQGNSRIPLEPALVCGPELREIHPRDMFER